MKAKLKGANGFVRFLLQHGEKIGIAAILVVAGMLVWSSLGRPVVEDSKQPEPLKAAAQQASSHVAEMSWVNIPDEEKTDFTKFSADSGDGVTEPVVSDQYPLLKDSINPNVIPPIQLRQDPVLVAAKDLEVRSGAGLWMSSNREAILANMREAAKLAAKERQQAEEEARRMAEEGEGREGRGGGRGPRGMGEGPRGMGMMGGDMSGMKTKDGVLVIPPTGGAQMQGFEEFVETSWVTVLAKVPFKQQIQMYEDALASARGFNIQADMPEYIGYEVERAEVTDEGPGEFKLLKRVFPKVLLEEMATWPIQTPELINPKYRHPLLTYPLPPMVMREWGEEVTHTDLPIPTPEELMGGAGLEETAPAAEKADAEVDPNDPFGSAARARTTPGMAMGGRGEMMMGRPPGMGMGGREMGMPMGRPGGMGMGGRGGEMGMGMPMGRGGMPGVGAEGQQELEPYVWDGSTKTLLFRFFDDTVQPGHRYRYRVRLVLKDVNVDQPPKYLDPTVSARQAKAPKIRYRMADWSEPSPVAVVPRPGLTFIASTKDVTSIEPEARLIVKSVSSRPAAEIAFDQLYTRGSVLNFGGKAKIIWSSLYKVDQEQPQDSPAFKFLTGMTLVDVDGGDQLVSKNRNLMAPARALMMDSAGRLSMENELTQGKTIREYDFILKQDAEATRRAKMNADDGGRGGGRGPRGGF